MKDKQIGEIYKRKYASVWPHEEITAQALIKSGDDVLFLRNKNRKDAGSADIFYRGEVWEIKSPKTDNLKAIERNIRRGKNQSHLIIFESRRIKKIPEEAILREVQSAWQNPLLGKVVVI